jgi:hypothetical protein
MEIERPLQTGQNGTSQFKHHAHPASNFYLNTDFHGLKRLKGFRFIFTKTPVNP